MLDAIVIDLDVPPAIVVNADVAVKTGLLADLGLGLGLDLDVNALDLLKAKAAVAVK